MSDKNFQYSFDGFTLLPDQKLLYCDNEIITLSCRAFDVLLLLIENQGKVLLKQELLDIVWSDKFVEEGNLAVAVNSLRNALKTEPAKVYIQTFPKRGYRFNADVEKVFVEAENAAEANEAKEIKQPLSAISSLSVQPEFPSVSIPQSSNKSAHSFLSQTDARKWLLLILVLIFLLFGISLFAFSNRAFAQGRQNIPTIQKSKILILPFANLNSEASAEKTNSFYADLLKHELSQSDFFSEVAVAESNGNLQTQKINEAAENIEADYVLAGTFLEEGEKIEVETQLIEIKTGKIVMNNKESFLPEQKEQFIKKIGFKIKLHSDLLTKYFDKNR